jgi:hemophore
LFTCAFLGGIGRLSGTGWHYVANLFRGRGTRWFDRKVFAEASKAFANRKEFFMSSTAKGLRRALYAVFAASAAGGAAVAALSVPSATAATDPCAASELARTIGSVATSTGTYLDSHPETNQALTTISQQQAGPQSLGAVKSYFDANPPVAKDMQQLQQPLVSLSSRCRLPISLPQLMGLMQAAQQQGGALPGGLPGAPQSAQSMTVPSVALPGTPSPATVATQGTRPLPGPSAATTR